MDIIRTDFKSGLEALLKNKPIRAIFLGVRIGDPTAVGQEQFSPISPGWPPFMRVNPILDWSYRGVDLVLVKRERNYNYGIKFQINDYAVFGTVEDQLGPLLCGKLHSIGWFTSQASVVRNDVETAQPLSKLCLEFPDLYIGCFRRSRQGHLVISFEGKDPCRVEAAIEALCKKFNPGAFSEV